MSPFAGEGANLAMDDGPRLALAIATHPGDVDTALACYEHEMFSRASAAAADSTRSLEVLFREDSPRGLLEMFAGFDHERATGNL